MSLRLTVLATTYDVQAPPELLATLQALFPAAPEVPRVRSLELVEGAVLLDGEPVQPVPTAADALDALLMAVNARTVFDSPGLSVHAGVVAAGGVAVAFPADSGVGKSTLTAACLRAGLDYVSDEALVLSWEDGAVLPYLKPLTLSAWSLAAVGASPPLPGREERPVTAGRAGLGPGRRSPAARSPAAAGARPSAAALRPAARGDGAAALLRNSFNHFAAPAEALGLAGAAMRDAECWTLRYDRPEPAAALVAELLR